jgi:hypothetical protein
MFSKQSWRLLPEWGVSEDADGSFRHQPLDHTKSSIRLVNVLPVLSPGGLIQCQIRHTTIDATYVCLSYRWGPPTPNRQILLNDRLFVVGQNLHDFLEMIRQKPMLLPSYWIDATCIDQTHTAEKNHQVSQMGDIFSHAESVQIWLGKNETLATVITLLEKPEEATPADWQALRSHATDIKCFICNNEYWDRAWVIQEIFLAQRVMIWADATPLEFEDLRWTMDYFYIAWKNTLMAQFKLFPAGDPRARFFQDSGFNNAKRLYLGASLIALLAHFRNKKCHVLRDRIFSMLSLCKKAHAITVDYGVPDEEVALRVLENRHGNNPAGRLA